MARYQKGAYKRDIILYNAKSLFYKKGIAGTTIKERAELSEEPVSLVHYYFKKKDDIVQQIYLDFLGNIDLFVYSSLFTDAGEPHVLLAHTVTQLIYYSVIMNDPRNMRVYQEALAIHSNAEILNTYIEHVYRKIIDELELEIPEDTFRSYVSIDFGGRRELLNQYYNGELQLSQTELVLTLIRIFPLMVGMSQTDVDAVCKKALDIFHTLDFKKLKFLV